jgi:hypothetical protein
MADNQPISGGILEHMLVGYLQVSDLPSQFAHLSEDDKPNYGVILYPRICASPPKTWIQIAVTGLTLSSLELHVN